MPAASHSQKPAISGAQLESFMSTQLELASLEMRIVRLQQKEQFRSAVGRRSSREALLLRWIGPQGNMGIAECSGRPDPFYNEEFLSGSCQLIREFVLPLLRRRMSLRELQAALSRIRGWRFTRAAVLDSAIDNSRRQGNPDLLDIWGAERRSRIPVGISLGIFRDGKAARERVGRAVASGYRRIKLKHSPAADAAVLGEALDAAGAAERSVDANCSFSEEHMDSLAGLATDSLTMLEQPFAADRLDLHASLRTMMKGCRLCLDEAVSGYGHLLSARKLGSLDELNLKPGRVGGQLHAVRLLQYCRRQGLGCWIGGMFETGVGRLANLRYASCLPQATAHDLSPSGRYFHEDIVASPLEMDATGQIDIGEARPVELDEETIERMTEHVERLEPPG